MKEKNGEHPFGDAGQMILFVLFVIVWIADSFWFKVSGVVSEYIPLWVRIVVAALLLAASLCLVKAGHAVLDKDQISGGVMSTGAFRLVRHPLYLGSILFYLCLTVLTDSLAALAMLVVIFMFYDYIARYEERLLVERFGDDYRRYRQKTGKWIPRLKSLRSSSEN